MLQNYLKEWANARENAVILEEQKDENGNLLFQRAEIVFQGVKIEIRNKRIMIDNTPAPEDKFCAEFFVPSTLTFIDAFSNSEYPHTEFIATMLEAIDPQFSSKMHDAINKRRDAMNKFITEKKEEWSSYFDGSSYSQDTIDFLLNFAAGLTRQERVDDISLFIKIMIDHASEINDDVIVIFAQDGSRVTAKDILYDLICRTCSKKALMENGKFVVSKPGTEIVFLNEDRDQRVPSYVLDGMKFLRTIFNECGRSMTTFTTVMYGLASYYAYIFNEPIAYRLAKATGRKNRPARRSGIVKADVMMNNIGFAFDEAQPIKNSKKSKKG